MKQLLIYLLLFIGVIGELRAIETEKLVVLGGGPAGLTCSLFAAQAHLSPLVIEGNYRDGQIAAIDWIENYPGFPEGISGEELSQRIKLQSEKFGTQFCPNSIVEADLSQLPFKLTFQDGEELYCESLVIATGASPKWLGLESERALIGHGVSANALEDAPYFKGKQVGVVGGGDSAMEQALLLANYAEQVTLFHKGDRFTAAKYLQERVFDNPRIIISLNTAILEILGVENEQVEGIIVKDLKTQEETIIQLQGIFICNGRKPNTDIFLGQLEMNERGHILTRNSTSKTSKEGVFAAGDITSTPYRKVTTAVASGCISALDAIQYLSEKHPID